MWTVTEESDDGPDFSCYNYWTISNSIISFRTSDKEDAEWLCNLLNTVTPQK